jgi:hypothetical protein
MIARMGGGGGDDDDDDDDRIDEYETKASRSRRKSSSGVQDVLLTSSLVLPAMMAAAWGCVSGRRLRKVRRAAGELMGWKVAAGRSCRVRIGERIAYGGDRSWRAMAPVTVKEAVGAQRPSMRS